MPTVHIVKQGEYISGIANAYGFSSYKKIWDDPQNAQLKLQRKNPNILFPGDRLVIPDKEERVEARATDARHRFQTVGDRLMLQLTIRTNDNEPVAHSDYTLEVEAETDRKQTDGNGSLEKTIKPGAQTGRLLLKSDDFGLDLKVTLAIGHLDPIETVTGQIARLNNLGYDAGDVQEPESDADRLRFRSAVEEFQCNEKLRVDGVCGPKTQEKLKAVHGC